MRSLAFAVALLVACSGEDPAPIACATVCGARGGTCVGEICRIVGTGSSRVQCPSGVACEVLCTHLGEPCRDGVRCAGATTCTVSCVGTRACQVGVDCADSVCDVTCKGDEACEGGVLTSGGGMCTSHCCGTQACGFGTADCANDNQCP